MRIFPLGSESLGFAWKDQQSGSTRVYDEPGPRLMRGINEVKTMEGTRAIHWLIFVLAHSHYNLCKCICAVQHARCRRLTGEQ